MGSQYQYRRLAKSKQNKYLVTNIGVERMHEHSLTGMNALQYKFRRGNYLWDILHYKTDLCLKQESLPALNFLIEKLKTFKIFNFSREVKLERFAGL